MFCAKDRWRQLWLRSFILVPLPVDFLKSSEARVNFRPFQAPRNWSGWGCVRRKEGK